MEYIQPEAISEPASQTNKQTNKQDTLVTSEVHNTRQHIYRSRPEATFLQSTSHLSEYKTLSRASVVF